MWLDADLQFYSPDATGVLQPSTDYHVVLYTALDRDDPNAHMTSVRVTGRHARTPH